MKRTTGDDLGELLKQAKRALHASELNLQLIVDMIPAPVAVVSPAGEVETLNQPCLEYFGKTLEELKGWASSDPVQIFYTTKEDRMGIGLSVNRSIVENHHGRLWATPNDGPGVTFSFSIPLATED